MSVEERSDEEAKKKIAPWASGTHLRKIEESVLIPNLMKEKAKVICKDYLDAFGACCNGRTLSLAWSCKKERDEMANCLDRELKKPELFEEAKAEYLSKREEFQVHYAKTGEKKRPTERKGSVMHASAS